MRKFIYAICLIVVSLFLASKTFAAEILQVRGPSVLQIGDRNRSYSVQLACFEVYPEKQVEVTSFLKNELRNRRRVNLKPQGQVDGNLIARVTPLGNDIDLTQILLEKNLGYSSCD